jgi:hypothetical protein
MSKRPTVRSSKKASTSTKGRGTSKSKKGATKAPRASKVDGVGNLFTHVVTRRELKTRLSKSLSNKKIEKLIDEYIEASSNVIPNMDVITSIAQKSKATKLLEVRFKLESEQYDFLAGYFREDGQPATYLVKKTIEEFITISA